MKIAISATNPCHLWPLVVELHALGALGAYYSGYPRWKLADAADVPVREHSLRTKIVYGALKFLPCWARPADRALFLWQDHSFDRWVGAHLEQADFIHAMPGQALATFRRARNLGVKTVLNHATGPVCEWVRIMEPEYRRAGLRLEDATMYDAAYFRRETEEYALADFHCSASTVVRDQLIATGIAPEKIWLVPYGADARIFHPLEFAADSSEKFRIVFAGQVGLRKGLGTLLQAFQLARREGWTLDFFGTVLPEARDVLERFGSDEAWNFHGPVSQSALAAAFQKASIVVLPSLEEGFGLVVPQALACGAPCVVSDCTGARDLIRHRENGSVFPVQNSIALADELVWWAEHPARVREDFPWRSAAEKLLRFSSTAT